MGRRSEGCKFSDERFSIGNVYRLVSFPQSRLQATHINSNIPIINCVINPQIPPS